MILEEKMEKIVRILHFSKPTVKLEKSFNL